MIQAKKISEEDFRFILETGSPVAELILVSSRGNS
ncbi:hypothetical protein AAUPMC_19004 [Pasteurella multocida subsp. multocida str. Anand1_cattle]|nr:hypothetical protein AAUPMC_19004 [Pasteurella multocida subsp. multocida str. Anand1_cattle]